MKTVLNLFFVLILVSCSTRSVVFDAVSYDKGKLKVVNDGMIIIDTVIHPDYSLGYSFRDNVRLNFSKPLEVSMEYDIGVKHSKVIKVKKGKYVYLHLTVFMFFEIETSDTLLYRGM